tara:strand:+ start:427 stop:1029 length:603 start_codon:yes stop_codon:yes gene_type:complete
MNKDIAFILGNGITRLQVNCESLLDLGVVYGCNRIYQEFTPSVLVSTDREMANEIQQSGYSARNIHYIRSNCKLSKSGSNIIPEKYKGHSSGPAALGIASESNVSYLYMIGMDLKGVNNKINNIYAGTRYYRQKNDIATIFDNWITQVENIFRNFSHKRYIHVNPLDNFIPDQWSKHNNYDTMNLDDFQRMINNMYNRIS